MDAPVTNLPQYILDKYSADLLQSMSFTVACGYTTTALYSPFYLHHVNKYWILQHIIVLGLKPLNLDELTMIRQQERRLEILKDRFLDDMMNGDLIHIV